MADSWAETIAAASSVLQLSGRTEVASWKALAGGSHRSRVARITLTDGSTVVAKRAIRDSRASAGPEERFANELASLEYLNGLRTRPPVPRLVGASAEHRLVVMEDLGEGLTLVDLLLGTDAAAAQAGLESWARSLAMINALSLDSIDAYNLRRATLGPAFESPTLARLPEWAAAIADVSSSVHAGAVLREAEVIASTIRADGPWTGLAVRDACPGNERVGATGVVLFDFEVAQAQCVLLDAAHVTRPFPNCWCQGRVPPASHRAVVETYMNELSSRAGMSLDRPLLQACETALAIRDAAQSLPAARSAAGRYEFAPTVAGPRERVGGALTCLAGVGPPALRSAADAALATLAGAWGGHGLAPPLYPAFT